MSIANQLSVRSLLIWAIAMVAVAAAEPAPADAPRTAAVAVLDLRVGLTHDIREPSRNLWQGKGQGGIIQLHQGHVTGALIPFAPTSPVTFEQLPVAFARFRSTLGATQAFEARACSAAPRKIATWFALEAPDELASDPDSVPTWVTRGIRVFGLAGRGDSSLATSAFPAGPERVVGLTAAGRRVAERVMDAGAIVDVANLSDAAILELSDLARQHGARLISTRASARAVLNRPGSLSDGQLRRIAELGGVVGLSFDRDLLGEGVATTMGDVLRQLDHLFRVAGPDAIAIASGFETDSIPVASLKSATRYPRFVEALAAHGLTAEQISKLLTGNAKRALCPAAESGN